MKSIRHIVGIVLGCAWVLGCQEIEGECWPVSEDGQGYGAGGGPLLPGTGGFGHVPPEPQGAGDPPPPGCMRVQDSPCVEKCHADYEKAAIDCGKIADDAQRKTCDENAYANYKSCRETCQKTEGDCLEHCKDQCVERWEQCYDDCGNDHVCREKCMQQLTECLKECERKCK